MQHPPRRRLPPPAIVELQGCVGQQLVPVVEQREGFKVDVARLRVAGQDACGGAVVQLKLLQRRGDGVGTDARVLRRQGAGAGGAGQRRLAAKLALGGGLLLLGVRDPAGSTVRGAGARWSGCVAATQRWAPACNACELPGGRSCTPGVLYEASRPSGHCVRSHSALSSGGWAEWRRGRDCSCSPIGLHDLAAAETSFKEEGQAWTLGEVAPALQAGQSPLAERAPS